MIGCQVVNAYDLFDFTAAQGVGDYHLSHNLIFALRYVMRLNKAGGEGFVTNNQITPEAYNYGTLGTSTINLLNYATLNAEFIRVEGTGTTSSTSALAVEGMRVSGNYVFSTRYGLHVIGGNYNICSWVANTLDGVVQPITVESGGVIRADIMGGRILSGSTRQPQIQAAAIAVSGGAPGSYLSLNGVEVEASYANGVTFADPGAGLLAITGGKLSNISQSSAGNAFAGISFDCAAGSLRVTGTYLSDTNPISESAGSPGIVANTAKSVTIVGNTFDGFISPLYVNTTTVGTFSGNTVTRTVTGSQGLVVGVGATSIIQSGNNWDVGPNYPTAPTAAPGTNTTQVANTAFVQNAIASGGGGGGTYTLPAATTTTLGGVKVDGTTVTINGSGVISAPGSTTHTGVEVDGATVVASTTTPYQMQTADHVVDVNKTTGAATAITLPTSPTLWTTYYIIDGKQDAGTNNITLTAPNSGTINGAATFVMNANADAITLIAVNATTWRIV